MAEEIDLTKETENVQKAIAVVKQAQELVNTMSPEEKERAEYLIGILCPEPETK